ncbi:MAG: hypothetical protein WC837_14125 [Bellilinea sp.]
MELKEFIAETLIQIIDGVSTAQIHAQNNSSMVAPSGKINGFEFYWDKYLVEFDVAITTTDSTEGKVGTGIFVAGFTFGGQAKGEISNQTFSHIKFSIPIFLPPQKEL